MDGIDLEVGCDDGVGMDGVAMMGLGWMGLGWMGWDLEDSVMGTK